MDLGGRWAAAEADDDLRRSFPRPDLDDSGWAAVRVPGHWRDEPAFVSSDGPLLYRRRFSTEALPAGQRTWLVMEGIFYQSDVWLDGSYLGNTEGYFFPHAFDVTAAVEARSEHLVAVEVGCERPSRRLGRRALIGVWADGSCIDPAYNPGGIWAPVRLVTTGPVRISSLRISCSEAGARRAVLELSALLDSTEPVTATLRTRARRAGTASVEVDIANQHPLAVGANRVRWRLEVPNPRLWWPTGMGEQALYDLSVAVEVHGDHSDGRQLVTGLRQVRMRDFRWSVNGEGVFLKGANLVPTRRDLANATPSEVNADVELAAQAGLNLLRVHAHIGRPELYHTADRAGILIWQDMPLHGAYRAVRRQALRQAAKAVELLGHHPSIALWCGHNEPFPVGPSGTGWRPGRSLRRVAAQALPNPNRSVLDRSIRRALERADPSRPVVSHSGVLPSLARGAASHLYFGWYHGSGRDLPRAARVWPAAARFVSEFGAQAVPATATFASPGQWPALDWDELGQHYCLQKGVFDQRVPPPSYASFAAWSQATQAYQADIVRSQVEVLRRLRSRPTGGFAVYCLNDAQPAISCSLVDYERRPKAAYSALRLACAPVLVSAEWPAPSYPPGAEVTWAVHVVNDLGHRLEGAVVEARLTWPGGGREWRFGGDVARSSCTFVGRLVATLPDRAALAPPPPQSSPPGNPSAAPGNPSATPGTPLGTPGNFLASEPGMGGARAGLTSWPLKLELGLRWASSAGVVENRYQSLIVAPRIAVTATAGSDDG